MLPATTLAGLARLTLRHLGDSPVESPAEARIWSRSEVQGYLRDGYLDFCRRALLVWDVAYLEALPAMANTDFPWERAFVQATRGPSVSPGVIVTTDQGHLTGRAVYDFPWEAAFVGGTAAGPRNCGFPWERAYLTTSVQAGVHDLPPDTIDVQRATHDGRRLQPLRASELEGIDQLYETTRGPVDAYTLNKEGVRRLRLYRIPSAQADHYIAIGQFGIARGSSPTTTALPLVWMHLDEWGIVIAGGLDAPPSVFGDFNPLMGTPSTASAWVYASEFLDSEVVGTYGLLRRAPNYHPARGPWGIARRFSQDASNTRVEYIRHGGYPTRQGRFELPDHYLRFLRFYAMARALARQGPGQDLELAEHYRARYDAGILRAGARMQAMISHRRWQMGAVPPSLVRPPRAQEPPTLGRVVG
jgi:hypothetical protein